MLFTLLCLSASLVSAVFGFGTALIVLSLGSYILPVKETIALATVLFAASTISKSLLFRQHIQWKLVVKMALASLPFVWLGAELMNRVPAGLLKTLLGLMVLLYLLVKLLASAPRWSMGLYEVVAGSAIYGFLSGLLGSGNLVKVILLREMEFSKEAFVGAMAATSVLANVIKLTVYQQSGLLHAGLKVPMLLLVCCAVGAALAGRYLLTRLSITQFDVGLNWILGISALGLIFQLK